MSSFLNPKTSISEHCIPNVLKLYNEIIMNNMTFCDYYNDIYLIFINYCFEKYIYN